MRCLDLQLPEFINPFRRYQRFSLVNSVVGEVADLYDIGEVGEYAADDFHFVHELLDVAEPDLVLRGEVRDVFCRSVRTWVCERRREPGCLLNGTLPTLIAVLLAVG